MSPFQIVLQAAICGAIIIGALAMLAAHWIHDALVPSVAAMVGVNDGDDAAIVEEYDDILDDEVDLPEPDDPGDEWDRARDRDLDYRRGVA